MPYTNCLTIADLDNNLDVFDEMPYSEIKHFIKERRNEDWEVEITDLDNGENNYCKRKTSIKFDLPLNREMVFLTGKEFETKTVILEYDANSSMAMFLDENCCYESDDEEDSDDPV